MNNEGLESAINRLVAVMAQLRNPKGGCPWDLEQIFGLTEGNIFHGEMTPEQLFFLRPAMRWANYRTPIRGLYLCGSGAHPGGGVLGAPGKNAAREILRDLRR